MNFGVFKMLRLILLKQIHLTREVSSQRPFPQELCQIQVLYSIVFLPGMNSPGIRTMFLVFYSTGLR